MRYYDIRLTTIETGEVVTFNPSANAFVGSPNAKSTWTSHNAGIMDPGALNVELDIASYPFGAFEGNLHVRIWGVGLPALAQAANLSTNYAVSIIGGMQPPFSLNSAAKPGQLAAGTIFQCYGNWEGVAQHLDMIIVNGGIDPTLSTNITLNWPAGVTLAAALQSALQQAFPAPGHTVQGAQSVQRFVRSNSEYSTYKSLQALAERVIAWTASGDYLGIQIRAVGNAIYLYDYSTSKPPIQIQFQDIIGQPTWLDVTSITFACVMRGDISIGDTIQLPSTLVSPYVLTTEEAAMPGAPPSNRLALQGTFDVVGVHHYGNFRAPDASQWRTVYVAVLKNAKTFIQ